MNWKEFEKSWLKSKKFLAFLFMEILLSLLVVYLIYCQKGVDFSWAHTAVFLGFAFNMGFIAVSFNLEQAKLDRYVRFAAIIRGNDELSKSAVETSITNAFNGGLK